MRWILLGVALSMAAACSAQEASDAYYGPPRVMDKSRNSIKIWAGWKADHLAVAEAHCAEVGLSPNLAKTQEYNVGYEAVYWYECV